jgi:hypothetical protein
MKNLFTLLLTVTVLVFLSVASASAQKGLGGGMGTSAGQGHGKGVDHDQVKAGSDAKGDHDSHTSWQTKFNERLQDNPALATKIKNLLGPGTTDAQVKAAESGFKDGGQFIAALHVSKNLGIPFDELKAKITGITVQANGQTTKSTPMSLGKAISELKPTLTHDQVNDAVKKADKQASEDAEKTSTKASE